MDYIYQIVEIFRRYFESFRTQNRQNKELQFYELIQERKFDEALKLAQQYPYLDVDSVYKYRWSISGATVLSIETVLTCIKDKLWVIRECARTVPISFQACRTLIDFGLREANLNLLYQLGNDSTSSGEPDGSPKLSNKLATKSQDSDKKPLLLTDINEEDIEGLIDFNHLNVDQKRLCRLRQDLLCLDQCLFAYETILGGHRQALHDFDHEFYFELRQKCPFEACINYARNGNPFAVDTMLNFYTSDLVQHYLPIISNFPETLSPYKYRNLLPCLQNGEKFFEWRPDIEGELRKDETDWSNRLGNGDSRPLASQLKEMGQEYERKFYQDHEYLKEYHRQDSQQLSSRTLSDWYNKRALEMESRTLLLTNPIHLLRLGKELNIPNLQETLEDLDLLFMIVYDDCSEDNIYLSLTELRRMPFIDRVLLMNNNEVKYRLFANALAHCTDDQDGHLKVKILNTVIELRKRDERIQMAYLKLHM